MERVWKAEQKAEAESKKIEQLRKELEEERAREDMQRHAVEQGIAKKKGERLDWMYAAAAGAQVDHELYLLGRPVDKAVDPMAQENEEDFSAPGASFMNDTGANTANDLAAKVRDDPLFLIKKKEEEKRKELLNNPVKMKQLKLMLQANLDKSSKKKKDKKKKSKREKEEKKKRKGRHAEQSDESEVEEREKAKENRKNRKEKYRRRSEESDDMRKVTKDRKKVRKERHTERSSESDDDATRERARESWKKKHSEEGKEISNGMHKNHHRESKGNKVDEYDRRTHHRNGDHYSSRHRSPERKRPQRRTRSRSPTMRDRERGEERRQRHHSSSSPPRDKRGRPSSPSHSPPRKVRKSPSPDRGWRNRGSAVTKEMDAAEKGKRLAAMMENAKWRDEQRGKNVKRYKDEDARLEAKEAMEKDKSATFLNDMKIQSFSSKTTSTVGDRIRRNINSVQRTPAALESFLAK